MKKFILLFALSPLYLFAQEKLTGDPVPSDKELQKIFDCPNGILQRDVTVFYKKKDTFEVRMANGSWGKSIDGKVTWETYLLGYITALIDCDTNTSPVEASFPVNFTPIFISCDSSIMLLEEYGAVYLAEVRTGTTYLVEICEADLTMLVGFDIQAIRHSTDKEIAEYKTLVLGEVVSPYTVISNYKRKDKHEKMVFSWGRPIRSLTKSN